MRRLSLLLLCILLWLVPTSIAQDDLGWIRDLLPGSEAPTVMPLDGTGDKVAVHAVCRENVFWETLENLKAAGASSLLVLPVEKMLA